MRTIACLPALLGLLVVGGCDSLDVIDLNNPGLEELQSNPTPTGVNTAASGLLIGTRAGIAVQNGYVSTLGILGRESYNFDPADPRFVTELLIGPLDGGSPAFGGNLWANPYANIRNANIVLNAVDRVTGLSDAQKEGIRGFTKTIQALDLLQVINTRDTFGAPIDVDITPTGTPAPIATKAQVFTRIATLLDEARTHLLAAGSSFSFGLSTGFTGFDTPATFLQFNRALRARVAVYNGDFNTALTALQASFLSTTAPLTLGVYHTYSTASGDQTNALFDPGTQANPAPRAIFAHPSILADAQLRAGGGRDLRAVNKVTVFNPPSVVQGITDSVKFTVYTSTSAPIPIIRNEELILLRAEANIGLNQPGAAVPDIDFIRINSGGLPAYSGPVTQAALLDELLYNKRYSLLFEGGHRWIDARRYGKLNTLPRDLTAHRVFNKFPFPINECLPRSPQPSGCSPEPGAP